MVDHVLTEGQGARRGPNELFQECFALQQRRTTDIRSSHARKIEHDVAQRLLRTAVDHPLQRCEVTASFLVQHHQFAVQACIAHRQRLHGLHHFGKIIGPIQTIAGAQLDLAIVQISQQAIAIPLDLVKPAVAVRRTVAMIGQLRLNACG